MRLHFENKIVNSGFINLNNVQWMALSGLPRCICIHICIHKHWNKRLPLAIFVFNNWYENQIPFLCTTAIREDSIVVSHLLTTVWEKCQYCHTNDGHPPSVVNPTSYASAVFSLCALDRFHVVKYIILAGQGKEIFFDRYICSVLASWHR